MLLPFCCCTASGPEPPALLLASAGESLRLCAALLAVAVVRNLPLGSAERTGGTYAGCLPLTMYVCSLSGVTTFSLPVSTLPSSLHMSSQHAPSARRTQCCVSSLHITWVKLAKCCCSTCERQSCANKWLCSLSKAALHANPERCCVCTNCLPFKGMLEFNVIENASQLCSPSRGQSFASLGPRGISPHHYHNGPKLAFHHTQLPGALELCQKPNTMFTAMQEACSLAEECDLHGCWHGPTLLGRRWQQATCWQHVKDQGAIWCEVCREGLRLWA